MKRLIDHIHTLLENCQALILHTIYVQVRALNDTQRIFIQNLRKARRKADLTQATVAEKCSLSTYYVTEIETGRRFPSIDTLQKLCEALDIRPYMLFLSEEDSFRFLDTVRDELYLGRLKQSIDEVFEKYH